LVRPAPPAQLASRQPAVAASLSLAEAQSLVQAAVSESEARQAQKTEKLVADSLRRDAQAQKMLAWAEDTNRYMERRRDAQKVSAYRPAAETRVLP
jgi:hypothetical protein